MKFEKKNIINILLIIMILLLLILIYGNSLKEGKESSQQSNAVVNFIYDMIPILERSILSLVVRKMAHFTEFFVLGLLIHTFCLNKVKDKKNIILILLFGYVFGAIDELIQTFVEGRNGNFIDTLIDYSGFITSFLIVKLIQINILKKGEKQHEDKN